MEGIDGKHLGKHLEFKMIMRRIPKGSVLVSLLYMLYLHKVCDSFQPSKYHKFTDYVQIYLSFVATYWREACHDSNF